MGADRFERQACVAEGGRDDYLFRYGCSLRARDVPEGEARERVLQENMAVCRPPLSDREALKCCASAYHKPSGYSPEIAAKYGPPSGRPALPALAAPGRPAAAEEKAREVPNLLEKVDLEGVRIPEAPDLTAPEQVRAQFAAMFRDGERGNVVFEAFHAAPIGAGEMIPAAALADEEAAETLLSLAGDAGAWLRVNPTSGEHAAHGRKGEGDADVCAFRHTLIECDPEGAAGLSEEGLEEARLDQLRRVVALRLPCACIVSSAHKSVHCCVRLADPGEELDRREWERRRDLVYRVCDASGLQPDPQCKNPSRLMRLAGAKRGGREQTLLAVDCGAPSFAEWEAWAREASEDAGYRPNVPGPARFSAWQDDPPQLRPVLIEGLLREGGLMYLLGGSKTGKTWLSLNLAASICAGAEFLGHSCRRGRVLYLDLEMQPGSLYRRIEAIIGYRSKLVGAPDYEAACAENLYPWCLRDYAAPLDALEGDICHYARQAAEAQGQPVRGFFKMAIIDPLYLVELEGSDENSAAAMSDLFRILRRIQRRLGCAVLLVHHHPKGASGAKDAIDRGAGSGAIGRNGDCILDISPLFLDEARQETLNAHYRGSVRPGEDVHAFRIEGVVRDFAGFDGFDVVWTYPVHRLASAQDRLYECQLRGADPRAEANAKSRDAGGRRREAIAEAVGRGLAACRESGAVPTKAAVYESTCWGEGTGDVDYRAFCRFFEARNSGWFPFRSTHSEGNTWIVEEAG